MNLNSLGTCRRCGAQLVPGGCPVCLLHAEPSSASLGKLPLWEDLGEAGEEFQVIDQFAVRRRIARGGMGEVFQARQLSTGRDVALKLLNPGIPAERVRREVSALAELDHPGIVKILHCGEHAGRAFFAMDLVDGADAAVRVRERAFTPEEAADCVEQVARAMAHAHQRGVLHRDLKPQNILIGTDRVVRVTDFGLARRLDDCTVTGSGEAPGTPSYMAPEQVDSRLGRTTVATDIYGLGATLYHLLTGEAPFRASTREAVFQLVLHSEPTPPRVLNRRVPAELEAICLKCLSKSPRKRYANAMEVAEALERFQTRKRAGWRVRFDGIPRITAKALATVAAVALVGAAGASAVKWVKNRMSRGVASRASTGLLVRAFAFAKPHYFMTELGGGLQLPVIRIGETNHAASVRIRTVGGSAVGNRDFAFPDRMIEFAAGQTEAIAGMPIWDNPEPNEDRTIVLELFEPSAGFTISAPNCTVTLLDNDTVDGPGMGVAGAVRVVKSRPTGGIVIAGGFNNAMGWPSFSVAELSATGMPVLSDNGSGSGGPLGWINAMQCGSDGSLFLAGDFSRYNDRPCSRCVRLGSRGALDPQFSFRDGPDNTVYAAALQADGRLVIAGDFLSVGGVPRKRIARLNRDGSLDPTFDVGDKLTTRGSGLALQPDGKILLAGPFQQFGDRTACGLVRLNPDGSPDLGFKVSQDSSVGIESVVLDSRGRILIGGWFWRYGGAVRHLVARLMPDGSVDPTFTPDWTPAGSHEPTWQQPGVRCVLELSNGKVLVAGGFATVNGESRMGLVRMESDGRLDTAFKPGVGAVGMVNALATLPDGRIFVAGGFHHFDGVPAAGGILLDPDGRVPARRVEWSEWPKATGGNDHEYALTSRPGTWEAAADEARAAGARLVTIDDAAEQAFLEKRFLRGVQKLRPAWIGLTRTKAGGSWAWEGGASSRYSNWASKEPPRDGEELRVALNHAFAAASGSSEGLLGKWGAVPPDGSGTVRAAAGPYYGIMERVRAK